MIKTKDIISEYGDAGDWSEFTKIELPYPMRIAWDKGKTIKSMWCHKKVALNFSKVFYEILEHYGLDKIKELGIDLYGGCINVRKMRGGSDWSRHSWGIALDLDPERNGLKRKWSNSNFSKPAYSKLIGIFYANGFVNLGVEKGYDGMHFEIKKND